ncbi:hypothetical protein P3L10_022990 [Capsicum annuum]|uniref:uncharacterized protein LOC124886645 n=1 Tax=Capsicum annuum TaxID=4072 RepID=UPI001FB0D034|nr:uncharacterized protein LOC124886645 [Capsicum annuum]
MVEVDEVDSEDSSCNPEETDNDSCNASDYSDYDSKELEVLAKERKRTINDKFFEYKELHRFMTFKDIAKARRFISLHALANGYNLAIKKNSKRFRVVCQNVCNFFCLISGEKNCSGVSVKTLMGKHKCDDPCGNYKVSATTLAYYFKEKLQAKPKYKIKDIRVDLKIAFNINASFRKCKRAKRMIWEKMEGSFCDDYKKLVGYTNSLLESKVGSDVSLKVLLIEEKRQLLRMYICFDALKFKAGLRPFIGLDGTFLKGKAKGQLLCVLGQDSINYIYPIAWAIVHKECKATWLWFVKLLQQSLSLNNGEGITLILDMQKELAGIPCPHAIKELLYKESDPREEIHWWYTKEAYLLTYHSKLQPVSGPKLWKIDPAEAIELPPWVTLAGRPPTTRKRDKD